MKISSSGFWDVITLLFLLISISQISAACNLDSDCSSEQYCSCEVTIDDMESTVGWAIYVADKSSIDVTQVSGMDNKAIKMTYYLDNGGWMVISKNIDPKILSGIDGIKFYYNGAGNPNTIEVKLIYTDENYNSKATFAFLKNYATAGDEWTLEVVSLNKFNCMYPQEICDNNPKIDVSKVGKIEFAVSNKPGDIYGNGTLIIDSVQGTLSSCDNKGMCKPLKPDGTLCSKDSECENKNCFKGMCRVKGYCGTNADCSSYNCIRNVCREIGYCETDSNCEALKKYCERNQCENLKKEDEPCSRNSECENKNCFKGICRNTKYCETDLDCNSYQYCGRNKCENLRNVSATCSKDSECTTKRCFKGVCREMPYCEGDSDCDSDHCCEGNKCEILKDINVTCSRDAECKTKNCFEKICRDKGYCKDGLGCDSSTQYCNESKNKCEDLKGNDAICSASLECAGKNCFKGICRNNGYCENNLDCTSNQFCEENTCKKYCKDVSDCNPGQEYCKNNKCKILGKLGAQCSAGSECETGNCFMETCREKIYNIIANMLLNIAIVLIIMVIFSVAAGFVSSSYKISGSFEKKTSKKIVILAAGIISYCLLAGILSTILALFDIWDENYIYFGFLIGGLIGLGIASASLISAKTKGGLGHIEDYIVDRWENFVILVGFIAGAIIGWNTWSGNIIDITLWSSNIINITLGKIIAGVIMGAIVAIIGFILINIFFTRGIKVNTLLSKYFADARLGGEIICEKCLRYSSPLKSEYIGGIRYCEHCNNILKTRRKRGKVVFVFGKYNTSRIRKTKRTFVINNPDFSERKDVTDVSEIYIDTKTANEMILMYFMSFVVNHPPKYGLESIKVFYIGNLDDLGTNLRNLMTNKFKNVIKM